MLTTLARRSLIALLFTLSASACSTDTSTSRGAAGAPALQPNLGAAPAAPKPSEQAAESEPLPPTTKADDPKFSQLFAELSEPDRYFFSDNYISNETSYLQVAQELKAKARQGGAYLGVGPEQNFSYIALTRPKLAFILDIRRGNALLHLLYKSIFHEANNRTEFVARLIGRDARFTETDGASLEQVLEQASAASATALEAETVYARLLSHIQTTLAVPLSDKDLVTLKQTHAAFVKAGLGLRFELHQKNGRTYPSLKQLLQQQDSGVGSFLASPSDFAFLKQLQAEHRIVPVVGDFAGEGALKRIAAELRRRDLPVSVFYTSNVEQYLMERETWARWVSNVDALPKNESSLFIRCYLDQGRKHPKQLKGHRTATVLQSFDQFKWKQAKQSYQSFWQLVTDAS